MVRVEYVRTEDQQADILTKPLAPKRFSYLRNLLGVVPVLILTIGLCVSTAESLRLNFRSKISPVRNQLVLTVESPCNKIKSVEKELAKPELSMKYKTNASMI